MLTVTDFTTIGEKIVLAAAVVSAIGVLLAVIRHVAIALRKVYDNIEIIATQSLSNQSVSQMADVIERVSDQLALLEQKQEFDWDHVKRAAVYITDQHGAYTYVSDAYCRMVGALPTELLGSGWINAIYKEDREHVLKEWREAVQDRRDYKIFKFRYFNQSSRQLVWASTYATVLQNARGEMVGYIGVSWMLTEDGNGVAEK